jgi:hypothetical protein
MQRRAARDGSTPIAAEGGVADGGMVVEGIRLSVGAGAAVGISAGSFAAGSGVFTPGSPADREHAATTVSAQSARSTRFAGRFLRQGGPSTGQHPRSDQLESV